MTDSSPFFSYLRLIVAHDNFQRAILRVLFQEVTAQFILDFSFDQSSHRSRAVFFVVPLFGQVRKYAFGDIQDNPALAFESLLYPL